MIKQGDAIIRKEYGIDPETLDYERWCKLYAEFLYLNKISHNNQKSAIIAAANIIIEAFNTQHVDPNNKVDT